MIVLATDRSGSALEEALLEEEPEAAVVSSSADPDDVIGLFNEAPKAVLPAGQGAVQIAAQMAKVLGVPHERDEVVSRLVGTVGSHPGDSRVAAPGQRYSADVVTREGRHLIAAIWEEAWKPAPDEPRISSRISVAHDCELGELITGAVESTLGEMGIANHATHAEIEVLDGEIRVSTVRGAPTWPEVPVDAGFSAFGTSFEHLVVEAALRPHEFDRRILRPPRRKRTALGCCHLWVDGEPSGADGLRVLRRLPGFHSLLVNRGRAADTPDLFATAAFIDADRDLISSSIAIVSELEDSGALLARDQEFISYATEFN